MRKPKHHTTLYWLVFFLLILQVASFVFFGSKVTQVTADLEKTRNDLTKNFADTLQAYDERNQNNFEEIADALSDQQAAQVNLQEELGLVKSASGDFSQLIEEVVRSVVSVRTDKSQGSGFFVHDSGYIITNHHVIQNANSISVLTADGKSIGASLIGEDSDKDLALLKIDNNNYDSLELADSDGVQVGRQVIAIGNPLGLSFTVTEGIVSAVDRTGPNGLSAYVQTDVGLNPGNSGGPLIDKNGEVIGINNFKVGGAENLGFALESDEIEKSINELAGENLV